MVVVPDREFHELFARDRGTWEMTVEAFAVPNDSAEPFDAWLANPDRVEY